MAASGELATALGVEQPETPDVPESASELPAQSPPLKIEGA